MGHTGEGKMIGKAGRENGWESRKGKPQKRFTH